MLTARFDVSHPISIDVATRRPHPHVAEKRSPSGISRAPCLAAFSLSLCSPPAPAGIRLSPTRAGKASCPVNIEDANVRYASNKAR